MDEKQIITGLINKQEPAFRELVNAYQNKIINTCFGIVHNLEDAEDIAQDVFIEVYNSISGFRSGSSLSTWMYRIAVNKSLNLLRKKKRQKYLQNIETVFFNEKQDNAKNEIISDEYAESKIENEQRARLLHEAIDALPQNQKIAFTLNKYEDLSYKEISEIMGVSLSSVESLIFRAKSNLQKKLYKCFKNKCI